MRSVKIPFLLSLAAVVLLLCSACSGTEQKVRTEPIRLQTTDGIWLNGVLRQPHPNQTEAGVLMVHGLADRLADPSVADHLKNSGPRDNQITVLKIGAADHRFRHHQKELEEIITQWLVGQLDQ